MISQHVLGNFVFEVPFVLKELLIIHQPISIEQKENWSIFQDCQYRVTQRVVHCWWLSVVVSNLDSLTESLVGNNDHGHWVHDWHTESIKHSEEGNIESIRVFEMNWHIFSKIYTFVSLDGSLSCSH